MHPFDTHAAVKDLIAGGLSEIAAEKIVGAITACKNSEKNGIPSKEQIIALEKQIATFNDTFATKADLKIEITNLRTELKTEIADLRSELKTEIAGVKNEFLNSKADLLKWYITGSITMVAVITGIIGGAMAMLLKILGH
jgi:hypothetical protein